jgi:hypothetical protein
MNTRAIIRRLVLAGVAGCVCATPGFAAGGMHCQEVGGGILTNFLDPSQCLPTSNSPMGNLCTDGVATGDLRGAIGVQVLNFSPSMLHNRHHWVTESGDTIFLADADLTNFPTSDPNRVLSDYLNGIGIIGGTGRFQGATGTIFAFGAGDLKLGEITLRYAGTVCFPTVQEP